MDDLEYEQLAARLTIHERLARLEVNDRKLNGNGQPGEIAQIREKIDNLKWWIVGSVVAGLSGSSMAAHFLPTLFKP